MIRPHCQYFYSISNLSLVTLNDHCFFFGHLDRLADCQVRLVMFEEPFKTIGHPFGLQVRPAKHRAQCGPFRALFCPVGKQEKHRENHDPHHTDFVDLHRYSGECLFAVETRQGHSTFQFDSRIGRLLWKSFCPISTTS